MVLTKEQAKNLRTRERELERLISMLKSRKQKISLSPSDLRGDRTLIEQKKLQKKKLEGAAKNLEQRRQKVKNLLEERVAKKREKNVMDMRNKDMERMRMSKNTEKISKPRESLSRKLFENTKMPKRFNRRRFVR